MVFTTKTGVDRGGAKFKARFKETIRLQKICFYSLINLRIIQSMRSNDHLVNDIKTLRQRVGFDTSWSTFN